MNYEATASILHIDFTRSQCLNHTLSAAISSKIIIYASADSLKTGLAASLKITSL